MGASARPRPSSIGGVFSVIKKKFEIEKVGNEHFTQEDLVHQLELQKKESINKLVLQEDFISYVIFLFLDENREKKELSRQKLVVNFSYALTLLFM